MVDSNVCGEIKHEQLAPLHDLYDNWTLWAHLPHDTDWTVKSYKKLLCFNSAEEIITLSESLPEKMVKNCIKTIFANKNGIYYKRY